jgi:hypothetical protein
MTLTISASADQQVVYPPSAMPRVDMHTHMDAKTQYAKAVEAMDQWGGTISISLAGLFWVKDNNGNNASPTSVRQIPGNDMGYVKEKLDDRILFVPGAAAGAGGSVAPAALVEGDAGGAGRSGNTGWPCEHCRRPLTRYGSVGRRGISYSDALKPQSSPAMPATAGQPLRWSMRCQPRRCLPNCASGSRRLPPHFA